MTTSKRAAAASMSCKWRGWVAGALFTADEHVKGGRLAQRTCWCYARLRRTVRPFLAASHFLLASRTQRSTPSHPGGGRVLFLFGFVLFPFGTQLIVLVLLSSDEIWLTLPGIESLFVTNTILQKESSFCWNKRCFLSRQISLWKGIFSSKMNAISLHQKFPTCWLLFFPSTSQLGKQIWMKCSKTSRSRAFQ